MRITRKILEKIITDTVSERVNSGIGVLSAFLCGSFLGEDYMLSETTDLDLVFIFPLKPEKLREIIPLNDQISLDITYREEKTYRYPKTLRREPWLGPEIYGCRLLYDPKHSIDFVQASTRAQFFSPQNTSARARSFIEIARNLWRELALEQQETELIEINKYLKAIFNGANSFASLSGVPLANRRLLLEIRNRAERLDNLDLFARIMRLVGAEEADYNLIIELLPYWENNFEDLSTGQSRLWHHPQRKEYFLRPAKELINSDNPEKAIWMIVKTWAKMELSGGRRKKPSKELGKLLSSLGLDRPRLKSRFEELDRYLDLIEETVDLWEERQEPGKLK